MLSPKITLLWIITHTHTKMAKQVNWKVARCALPISHLDLLSVQIGVDDQLHLKGFIRRRRQVKSGSRQIWPPAYGMLALKVQYLAFGAQYVIWVPFILFGMPCVVFSMVRLLFHMILF